jgi:hypothetical protein
MTLDESIVTRALRDRREAIERADRAEAALAADRARLAGLVRYLWAEADLERPGGGPNPVGSPGKVRELFRADDPLSIEIEALRAPLCQHMIPVAECRVVGCQP